MVSANGEPSVSVSLRLIGEDIDVNALSDRVGATASRIHAKGDKVPGRTQATYPSHLILYTLPEGTIDEVDHIITTACSYIASRSVITYLDHHNIARDIVVSCFSRYDNFSFSLRARTIELLHETGVAFSMSVYILSGVNQ